MVIRDGNETLVIEISKSTGVYKRDTKYGHTETPTHKRFNRAAFCHVLVELDEAGVKRMIRNAYRAKGHKSVDGPLKVTVKELRRIEDVEIPCSLCGKLHDFGIPCAKVK